MNEKILLVDDEQDILRMLSKLLSQEQFHVRTAQGGDEAIELFESESFDAVVTDMRMPGMDGLGLIQRLKEIDKNIEVIILTGYAELDNVIQAFRNNGAFDYLTKPLENINDLFLSVNRAIESRRLKIENRVLLQKLTRSKEDLEKRVADRTQELTEANKRLQCELSQRQKTERELKRSMAAAEAANLAKSNFLANMSHELRTPLNHIIGFTELVADGSLGELNPAQKTTLDDTLQSSRHLLSLINDILDFSKIEADQLSLESIDFDPEMTVYHVCDLIRPQVLKKPIEILCRVGRDVPGFVKGDPGRFRQVLINLMSNAAKFTDTGEIELGLNVEKEDAARVKLHATVRDSGAAIPKDKLKSIFEVFEQGDTSTTRRYGGTGLGLSICRRIAKLMKGKVWAESEPGKGNLFHFTAWLDKSENRHHKAIHPVSLTGKKVLVVDDNPAHLEIFEHILEPAGMRLSCLSKGRQVVATLQAAIQAGDPFACCILDVELTDPSGYDIARKIRHPDSQIPSIALLAFSIPAERRAKRCLQAGFDGFLPVPIRRDRLIDMLIRLLGEEKPKIPHHVEPSHRELVTQYSIREETKHAVWILLAEDNLMSQKLATLMLKKAGYRVVLAENGREVIDEYTAAPDKFSLLFMDIQMPQMDGLEATQTIREWEKERQSRRIPIVALTANAMKGDRERCLAAGMDDYASKPIEREVVFALLEKWVLKSGNASMARK